MLIADTSVSGDDARRVHKTKNAVMETSNEVSGCTSFSIVALR
jgi:hypothetical protein